MAAGKASSCAAPSHGRQQPQLPAQPTQTHLNVETQPFGCAAEGLPQRRDAVCGGGTDGQCVGRAQAKASTRFRPSRTDDHMHAVHLTSTKLPL